MAAGGGGFGNGGNGTSFAGWGGGGGCGNYTKGGTGICIIQYWGEPQT